MSSTLFAKSSHGRWVQGKTELHGKSLRWKPDDDGQDKVIELALNDQINVKIVQFGLRKHVFEIDTGEKLVQFSAKNDADRQNWVEKVSKKAGIALNSKKDRTLPRASNIKVAGLKSMLQGLPGGATLGGGVMTPEEATKKLREKLRGKVEIEELSEKTCVVCNLSVTKEECVKLAKQKEILHYGCFYCAACGETLTLQDYKYDKSSKQLFCADHFEGSEDDDNDDEVKEEEEEEEKEKGQEQNSRNKSGTEEDRGDKKEMSDEEETKGEKTDPEYESKKFEPRNNASGISHSAVLSRPTVRGRRRPTNARATRRAAPIIEVPDEDKEDHFNSFYIKPDAKMSVCVYPQRLIEKRKFVDALVNSKESLRLQEALEQAQRVDMFSAIQAQMNLENFEQTHQTSYQGIVYICLRKKAKDLNNRWLKCFAELEKGSRVLVIYDGEEKKKQVVKIDIDSNVQLIDASSGKKLSFAGSKEERRSARSKSKTSSKKQLSSTALANSKSPGDLTDVDLDDVEVDYEHPATETQETIHATPSRAFHADARGPAAPDRFCCLIS